MPALFYADASALVKLVRDEPESDALRKFLGDAELTSCELVITEAPRAVRRAVADDPKLPLAKLIERTVELLEAVALLPLNRDLLVEAGALEEPMIRSLDAIHVTSALSVEQQLDGFVSYDARQSATARLAGLRTMSPTG